MSAALPEELRADFAATSLAIKARAFDVDTEYARRGFRAVGAIIERDVALFGECGYTLFIERQLEDDGYLKNREADAVWAEKLDHARLAGTIDDAVQQLRQDASLHAPAKLRLIGRYAPLVREAMLLPYSEGIRAAAMHEREALCGLYSTAANRRLFASSEVPVRREIWNAVGPDAFSSLGFTAKGARKGAILLHKKLNERFGMVVEVDSTHLSRESVDQDADYGDIVGMTLVLNAQFSLVSAVRRGSVVTEFAPPYRSYAAEIYRHYGDSRSLEVSIRALALQYELSVMPYERSIVGN